MLFTFVFIFLSLKNSFCQGTGYKTQNVFLVVIDGIRNNEAFESGNTYMPFLWDSLRHQGTIYTNFQNRGITVTNAGHSTLVTGVRQLLPNNAGVPAPLRPEEPTMGEYYRKALGIAKEKVFYISGKNTIWRYPVSLYPGYGYDYAPSILLSSANDSTTWRAAQQVIDQYHPSLSYVLFAQVDGQGHSGDTAKYLNSIRRVDSLIFLLWKKIQNDPLYHNRTTIIITSDHGRHDDAHGGWKNHGDYCHGCRHIPFIAIGPDIKADTAIAIVHDQIDIVPTIAHLLGFPVPLSKGNVMSEMIVNYHPQIIQKDSSITMVNEINLTRDAGNARSCAVVFNAKGIHVVFTANTNGRYDTYYTKSTDGGVQWTKPQAIFTSFIGDDSEPAIAALDNNKLFAVSVGYRYNSTLATFVWTLRGKRSTNSGDTWEAETFIDTLTTVSCKPSISAFGNSICITALKYYNIINYLSTDGGKSFKRTVVGNTSFNLYPSCTLIDSTTYAVWQNLNSTDPTSWDVVFEKSPWTQPSNRLTKNDTLSYSYHPTIAADEKRNLHLFYMQLSNASRGNRWQIMYQRSADFGKTWSTKTNISQSTSVYSPVAKVSDNGSIHSIWADYSNNQWTVRGTYSKDNGATRIGPYSITSAQSFSLAPDFAVTGDTLFIVWQDHRNGKWDIYFKKFVVPTATEIKNERTGIQSFYLFQNYPNPFSQRTTMRFETNSQSAEGGRITLRVFDLLGREVATLFDGSIDAGMHTVEWDASGVPRGMYLCRLVTAKGSKMIKLMLAQ